MNNNPQHHKQLNEGLEGGDLKRLVHPELHIDEFRSKLGRDEDVCVLSFKVAGKEPAEDLMSFCEKGYTWILDADVSSGEMSDGDYAVFVELERNRELPHHVMELMADMMNLTEQSLDEWRVRYHTNTKDHELTEESIAALVPLDPATYKRKHSKQDIDQLKTAAGIDVDTKAPKNDYTESLRIAAGII